MLIQPGNQSFYTYPNAKKMMQPTFFSEVLCELPENLINKDGRKVSCGRVNKEDIRVNTASLCLKATHRVVLSHVYQAEPHGIQMLKQWITNPDTKLFKMCYASETSINSVTHIPLRSR